MTEEMVGQLGAFLLAALIVGVPAVALSLRFALKPLVEAYARVKETQQGGAPDSALITEQLAALDHRLSAIEGQLSELSEVRDFHRELQGPAS